MIDKIVNWIESKLKSKCQHDWHELNKGTEWGIYKNLEYNVKYGGYYPMVRNIIPDKYGYSKQLINKICLKCGKQDLEIDDFKAKLIELCRIKLERDELAKQLIEKGGKKNV